MRVRARRFHLRGERSNHEESHALDLALAFWSP